MAMIFRAAPNYLKVALIFMTLGLMLFIIGFSTSHWQDLRNGHSGLWQVCTFNGCYKINHYDMDYHRTVQAMECIGLIGFGLSFLAMLAYFCVDSFRRRDYMQAATALAIGGVVFASIGLVMYGTKTNYTAWSFGVTAAGTASYGVAGIMLLLHVCNC